MILRQVEKYKWLKGSRILTQLVILVLVMIPLLLSCGGGDDSLTVDAGPDQNVGTGTLVTLDGSGSEGINDNNVTCSWSFASVPVGSALINADISDADTVTPTFTPDVDGSYVLRLEVDDGMFSRRSDAVTVTAWTTFEKTYGGANGDYGYSVQQTADGGFIVAGLSASFDAGLSDVYLIKTDASGNVEWEETYGGASYDGGYSVQQTADGGFVITGYTYAPVSLVYLVKTDISGTVEWEKTYDGLWGSGGESVRQTTDGGFIVTGFTDGESGPIDVYLIKTDASGNPEWEMKYGGTNGDYGYSVQQTTDGGFVVAGYTSAAGSDVYLIKTDDSGTLEWEKTYGDPNGGSDFDRGMSVQETTDGGFVVTGTIDSNDAGNFDVYLVKTDASGTVEWEKTYGGANVDSGLSVQQTTDGGFVVAGVTASYGAGLGDVYLVKTDASGNVEWEKTYGGASNEGGEFVQQTTDGGFVITGVTNSYGAGSYDVYLIKTDSMGNVY